MKSIILKVTFFIIVILFFNRCGKDKNGVNPSGPPTITAVSNTIAGVGYNVIVVGTNFSTTISKNSVSVNGIAAIVTSASSTQLSFIATNATTGKITVTVNGNSVTSSNNITIQGLSVSTLAGSGLQGADDGAGTTATFNGPWGIALDANNNLYVADSYNNKIRKIAFDGTVSTVAGTGVTGNNDGLAGTATFNVPYGIALDKNGNIYVSDLGADNIRKITPDGVVSTFAGSAVGATGSADGVGTSATFKDPVGLATDANGNVYVADAANNKIRKITPDGTVTTLAGTGAVGAANGAVATATFNTPLSIAVDGNSNLFVTEKDNYDIREITSGGIVSTVAGSGQAGSADGQGISASFNFPVGIGIDAAGNLYVTDNGYGTIRIITTTGNVATLAGNGLQSSVDGLGYASSFNDPLGMVTDGHGTLYVVDNASNKVRKIVIQ